MLKTYGKVKFFNQDRGYGFIVPDNGQRDVFVHITAVQQSGLDGLKEGQRVAFEMQEQRGKVAACNLVLAD